MKCKAQVEYLKRHDREENASCDRGCKVLHPCAPCRLRLFLEKHTNLNM